MGIDSQRCLILRDGVLQPATFGCPIGYSAGAPDVEEYNLPRKLHMKSILLFSGLALFALNAQQYTRGVGVYPGDPKADFAPTLVEDAQTYRNLALHRPAYQSSTYDFNLAAQLVTDGIKDTKLQRWISIATSDRGTLSRQEREHPVDHNTTTRVNISGPPFWIQVELSGGEAPLEIDRIDVTGGGGFGRGGGGGQAAAGGSLVVSGSDDGQTWKELGCGTPPSPAAPPAAPTAQTAGAGRAGAPGQPPTGGRGFGG